MIQNVAMIEAAAERHKLELLAYDVLAALIDRHGLDTVLLLLRYWYVAGAEYSVAETTAEIREYVRKCPTKCPQANRQTA